MKKSKIITMYQFFESNKISKIEGFIKFQYCILKNKRIIKEEFEALNTLIKPYEDARNKLIVKYAKKDDDKNLIIKDNNVTIEAADKDILNKELKILIEDNKELIDTYEELLKEEVNLEFYKISLSDITGLNINTSELEIIEELILD
jgi:hypothetical protein